MQQQNIFEQRVKEASQRADHWVQRTH